MADTPLKAGVEARRRAEWDANENAFLADLHGILRKEIKNRWLPIEGYSMTTTVTREQVTAAGPITPGVNTYVKVIEWACAELMIDSVFSGFSFSIASSGQDSDGCWGESVKILISSA